MFIVILLMAEIPNNHRLDGAKTLSIMRESSSLVVQDFWTINSIWERFSPILTVAYVSDGLVQPPTRNTLVNSFSVQSRSGPGVLGVHGSNHFRYDLGLVHPINLSTCAAKFFKCGSKVQANQSFGDPTIGVVSLNIFTWLHSGII